ncbi:hypothetical protein HQO83_03810 [Rhodococcus fascians]|nr:hypothetical protein [Rhodococcus fascians]
MTVSGSEAALQPTTVTLVDNQSITFAATGSVVVADNATVGPAGTLTCNFEDCPIIDAPIGALIGKIGSGPLFVIGDAVTTTGTGVVSLGINDTNFLDNSGSFSVVATYDVADVEPEPEPETPAPCSGSACFDIFQFLGSVEI